MSMNNEEHKLYTVSINETDFDFNKVIMENYKKDQRGGGCVDIYVKDDNNHKCPLIIEIGEGDGYTAFMGLTKSQDAYPKYSAPISVDEQSNLYSFMKKFEEHTLMNVMNNLSEWIPNKNGKSIDILREFQREIVKPSKKDGYLPNMTLKFPTDRQGVIRTSICNSNGMIIDNSECNENTISPRSKITALIEFSKLWIIDDKFSTPCNVLQCKLEEAIDMFNANGSFEKSYWNDNNSEFNVIKPEDFNSFDFKNIIFKGYEKDDRGGGSVKVCMIIDGKEAPLMIETTQLDAFCGLYTSDDEPPKHSLPVSVEKNSDLFNFLNKMKERMIDETFKNRATWLPNKKNKKKDIIVEFARSTIKEKEGYSPSFTLKLPNNKEGELRTTFYDASTKIVENIKESIVARTKTKCVIVCSQMWIIDDKYSMPWTALQVQVEKPVDKYKALSSSVNSMFNVKAEESKDGDGDEGESGDDEIIDENDFESEDEEEPDNEDQPDTGEQGQPDNEEYGQPDGEPEPNGDFESEESNDPLDS